jgi:hypothetical protein
MRRHAAMPAFGAETIGAWIMSIDTTSGHPAMDYQEHVATYRGFIKLLQFGVVGCVLLLVFLAVFVA